MTTTYGTIPTLDNTNIGVVVSNAKQRMRSDLCRRRPWKEMISFTKPQSFPEALHRIQTNLTHFNMNYVIIILFMVFISLLWHPVSLIAFMFMMVIWLFLYFLRDDQIIILGYMVDDGLVLVVLSIVTIVVMFLTRASVVVLGLLAGLIFVLLHGAFRQTDELSLIGEADGWGTRLNLKETASSSYASVS